MRQVKAYSQSIKSYTVTDNATGIIHSIQSDSKAIALMTVAKDLGLNLMREPIFRFTVTVVKKGN